ncbi:MAG: hypothetical protein MZU95_10255 [Desulfomicrobium escambiense]|nr:hypothetical protein [Desulfomicrobium escambiense]
MVFDVRRHAVHDGPGIRTTIFLKGCPLMPLVPQPGGPRLFARARIKARALPSPVALATPPARTARWGQLPVPCAGACAQACPNTALEMVGARMSVADVVRLALSDEPYYEGSGGGVTFFRRRATGAGRLRPCRAQVLV